VLGRFLQVDPVPGGGVNAYAYPPDPINANDYSGNATVCDWILLGLTVALVFVPIVDFAAPELFAAQAARMAALEVEAEAVLTSANLAASDVNYARQLQAASKVKIGENTEYIHARVTKPKLLIKKWLGSGFKLVGRTSDGGLRYRSADGERQARLLLKKSKAGSSLDEIWNGFKLNLETLPNPGKPLNGNFHVGGIGSKGMM
jgi:hypothetical protein